MKKSERDKYWTNLIQNCRVSGLSDYEWCRINHIATSSFYYNVKRLRMAACTDAVEINKAILSPNICDIGAPCSVRTLWVELLIKDVVKFIAKIRISGSSSPGFNPLSFNTHFMHVFTYGAFGNGFARIPKFLSDFRSTIILFRIIIDSLDFLFYSVLTLFSVRYFSIEKRTVSRAGYT